MQFDYFYGSQSESFSFYRIPRLLITDPAFRELSSGAKLLYGLLLDRMGLTGAIFLPFLLEKTYTLIYTNQL